MRARLTLLVFLAALALICAMPAGAAMSFSLAPSSVSVVGSNEVVFAGSLSNSASTNLYLNDIEFTLTDSATNFLAGDTNFFFQNIPGIFSTNQAYADVALGVFISPTTPVGTYSGTASILGGGEEFATNDLANISFQISLPPPVVGLAISATNLVLTWPVPPGGMVLQQNSDLTTTNWITNNFSIFTNGTTEGVDITPGTGNLFFRLSQ
jgi:hypothetical protein